MYTLEPLSYEDSNVWEDILTDCPNSLPFHSIAWREALVNTFKQLTPAYFLIKERDTIVGGLPAFVFQPIPGIKMLHSMPWNLFGSVQLITEASVDLHLLFQSVEADLDEFVNEQGLCETIFTLSPAQTITHGQKLIEAGYKNHRDLFTHLLRTHPDYDVIWQAFRGTVRTAVRKAAKTGVTLYDTNSVSDLEAFYEIYLATQKRLGGTPKPLPVLKSLFQNNIAKLVIARYDGLIIAGIFWLYFNRTVTVWLNASVPDFWEYCPNDALYHHTIKWACETGYEWIDFGASPPNNHGLIAFKESFRAKRFDFGSYISIHAPVKRAVWERSEPTFRQIYTWVQRARN